MCVRLVVDDFSAGRPREMALRGYLGVSLATFSPRLSAAARVKHARLLQRYRDSTESDAESCSGDDCREMFAVAKTTDTCWRPLQLLIHGDGFRDKARSFAFSCGSHMLDTQ